MKMKDGEQFRPLFFNDFKITGMPKECMAFLINYVSFKITDTPPVVLFSGVDPSPRFCRNTFGDT